MAREVKPRDAEGAAALCSEAAGSDRTREDSHTASPAGSVHVSEIIRDVEGEATCPVCILNGEILGNLCSLNINWLLRCITISGGQCALWVQEMCSSVRKPQCLADGVPRGAPEPQLCSDEGKGKFIWKPGAVFLQHSKLARISDLSKPGN